MKRVTCAEEPDVPLQEHLNFSLSDRAGTGGKGPGEKETQGDFSVCK